MLSEAPAGANNARVRAAINLSGGTKKSMNRVNEDKAHRIAKVAPDGPGPVRLSFNPTADCADAGALCTAAFGRLESPVSIQIAGPPPAGPTPLTARFENVPTVHEGNKYC